MMRSLRATLALLVWVGLAGSSAILSSAVLSGCESGGGEMVVTNIEPRAGATQGDLPVRIHGANFRQDIGYTVYFGAKRATQVTIFSDQEMVVASPQHDSGPVDVVIAADNGPAFRIVNGFTYADQGGNVMEQMHSEPGARPTERF